MRNPNAIVPADANLRARVAAIADRQWGKVKWSQLIRAGAHKATVSRWIAGGYLHPDLPGIYAVGHTACGPEGDLAAALLYAGPGAMLSHGTAAWWWGLVDQRPPRVEVSTARRCSSPRGVKVHARRHLDRVWHRGFTITTIAQTLLDFAAEASVRRVRRALAEADYRRLLELGAVEAIAGQGRRGSDTLRQALDAYRPELARTRSQLEERFVELCERAGLPPPELNVTICGLLVDAVWREQRVIVELDGYAAHGTPAQLARDRERDLRLRTAGFTVLRYTWRQITRDPGSVVRDLQRALRLD